MNERRMDAPSHGLDNAAPANPLQLAKGYSGFHSILFDGSDAGSVIDGREVPEFSPPSSRADLS
jgi:hypothetical protein